MISNSQIKIIKSLRQKKFRVLHNQFIAEGDKTIIELIRAKYKLCNLFSVNSKVGKTTIELTQITTIELKKISNLSNPKNSIAIFSISLFLFFSMEESLRVLLAFYVTYLIIFEIQAVNRSYVEDTYLFKKRQSFSSKVTFNNI